MKICKKVTGILNVIIYILPVLTKIKFSVEAVTKGSTENF